MVTLLRGLYLWNRKPDWQAVFFGGYPHSFYRVWDQCRIMPVPTVARGAVLPGGMSQMFRLLFLGNGWADCIEIWYAVGDPLVTAYAVIMVGVSMHVLTCRGTPHHRASVSRKRIGRLCSNLVCGLVVINQVPSTSHWWSTSARAHVHTALLYLRNGSAD